MEGSVSPSHAAAAAPQSVASRWHGGSLGEEQAAPRPASDPVSVVLSDGTPLRALLMNFAEMVSRNPSGHTTVPEQAKPACDLFAFRCYRHTGRSCLY